MYERRIDRLNPALILVLIDQSESMTEAMGGTTSSKAKVVADQINGLLYELILRCVKTPGEKPRPYFSVGVIGYSTTQQGGPAVVPLLAGAGSDGVMTTTALAASPLRIDRQPAGERFITSPVWVDPTAQGGTPMCRALDLSGRIVSRWVHSHREAFPPIVINMSDGEPTDGDPRKWFHRLTSLRTEDGAVLLFNIHLSAHETQPTLFPARADELPDQFSRSLFDMSSELPDSMFDAARTQGIDVEPQSRGFAYNADATALALFLNVGTNVGRAMR